MTAEEKIKELELILENAIEWYKENKEDTGRTYDESYLCFENLRREHCRKILEILSN